MFAEVASVLFPLIVGLVVMLVGSWLLSRLLYRYSDLDAKTSLFCCVPGGASVMLLLSHQYGADQRVVAAFQSSRVVLLVFSIPAFAGMVSCHTAEAAASASQFNVCMTYGFIKVNRCIMYF